MCKTNKLSISKLQVLYGNNNGCKGMHMEVHARIEIETNVLRSD